MAAFCLSGYDIFHARVEDCTPLSFEDTLFEQTHHLPQISFCPRGSTTAEPETTIIYTHVLQRGGLAVKSPLDEIREQQGKTRASSLALVAAYAPRCSRAEPKAPSTPYH